MILNHNLQQLILNEIHNIHQKEWQEKIKNVNDWISEHPDICCYIIEFMTRDPYPNPNISKYQYGKFFFSTGKYQYGFKKKTDNFIGKSFLYSNWYPETRKPKYTFPLPKYYFYSSGKNHPNKYA